MLIDSRWWKRAQRLQRMTLVVGCLAITVLVTLPAALTRLGLWLQVQTRALPEGARVDAIVVLGGSALDRMESGVDLFHQGVAPRVVLTGYQPNNPEDVLNAEQIARDYAIEHGVPVNDFTMLETVSTIEDARQIVAYAQENRLSNVVIVSDWSHARRAICSIHRADTTDQLDVYFRSSTQRYQPATWWLTDIGLTGVFDEVVKSGFYLINYGVPLWGCFPGDANLLIIIGLIVLCIPVAWLFVAWVLRNANRLQLVAIPNERSSHDRPTPSSGGMGIAAAVVGMWLCGLLLWPDQFVSLGALGIVIPLIASALAVLGWLDDRRTVSATLRMLLYGGAACATVAIVGSVDRIELPYLGPLEIAGGIAVVGSLVWLLGFINVFNFMDGIDGLAGSQAVIACLFWMLVLTLEGQHELVLLAGLIAGASAGFLIHNWPPARIFMGDVGSVFLGFMLSVIPVLAFASTGNARFPVVGVFFVLPFVLDGGLTIVRRAVRRENIFKPHRSHVYQRRVIAGKSHRDVALQYQVLMLIGGTCGVVYYFADSAAMLTALIVGVGAFSIYAAAVAPATST